MKTKYTEDIYNLFQEFVVNFLKKDLNKFIGKTEQHTKNKIIRYFRLNFEGRIKNQVSKTNRHEIKIVSLDRILSKEDYEVVFKSIWETEREQKKSKQNTLDRDAYKCFKKQNPESKLTFKKYVELLDKEEDKNIAILQREREFERLIQNEYESDEIEDDIRTPDYIKFLKYNWKKNLTKKQIKKVYKLIAAINQGKDIFDPQDSTKLKISEISKILYPNIKPKNSWKPTDEFLKQIKRRLTEQLEKANILIPTEEEDDIKRSFLPIVNKNNLRKVERYPCYVYRPVQEGEKVTKYIHGKPYILDRIE